jgi:hydroxymethylpyrimidine pyrophosphatase-like HAD family hydrolase
LRDYDMSLPIAIISTDFDGTLHAEHEDPPIPRDLERLIADCQRRGTKWIVNTGRDLSSLLETIARAHLAIMPDFVVVVEREIYRHENAQFIADEAWNNGCHRAHTELFRLVRRDVPRLVGWINQRFVATVYEDAYSPFCLIANHNHDADAIVAYLETYCREVPQLTVMRNDVYARFSHAAYHKGTALGEIARQLGVGASQVLAAGDHFNDLPMLSTQFAQYLVAPANAIPAVKEAVQQQDGYVSHQPWGHGVARGLEFFLEKASPAVQPTRFMGEQNRHQKLGSID